MSPRLVLVRKKQNWHHLQFPWESDILSGEDVWSSTTLASDGAWEQRGKTFRRSSSVEHTNNFCSHTFSAYSFGNQTLRILFEVTRARMYFLPFKIIIIICIYFLHVCLALCCLRMAAGALDPTKMDFQLVVNHHVDAWNFFSSSGVKILLSHLSSPQRDNFEYIQRWMCEDVAHEIKNKTAL